MRISAILSASALLLATVDARLSGEIESGRYELCFQISDIVFVQNVTLTGTEDTRDQGYVYFSIAIVERGSLNSGHIPEGQSVIGIAENGVFRFVIPRAHYDRVDPFMFEGRIGDSATNFEGSGNVPTQGPNLGENEFNFTMNLIEKE